jgi:DNA-binding Xre family transcriptional regulator
MNGAAPRVAEPVIINRLSRLMGERRLSIQDVARASGLSYKTVFDLYHARTTRYDQETLNRLCRALGVAVGEILEYVPEQGAEPPAD